MSFRGLVPCLMLISSVVGAHGATWKYVEEIDPMTDAKRQYVYGIPDAANPSSTPYIRIGCYGARDAYPMGMSFFWNEPLEKKYRDGELSLTTITFRLDQEQPRDMVWNMTADQSVTYPPDGFSGALSTVGDAIIGSILPNRQVANASWTAPQLHFTMLNADRVVFRAYSMRGQSITVTFTMDGYWQAIAPFADHCQGVVGRYVGGEVTDPAARKLECLGMGIPDRSPAMSACLTDANYRR